MKRLRLKVLLSVALATIMLLTLAAIPVAAADPPTVPSPANPTAPPQGDPPHGPPSGTPPEDRPGAHPHDPYCYLNNEFVTICSEAEWEPGDCWTISGHVWENPHVCWQLVVPTINPVTCTLIWPWCYWYYP